MAGDEIFLGFSGGTIGVVVGLIVISVLGGITLEDSYFRELWT